MASHAGVHNKYCELPGSCTDRYDIVLLEKSAIRSLMPTCPGLGADAMKNQLGKPRSFCCCIVAVLFVISQYTVIKVGSVENLWYASALLGLAYGGVFGLFPTLVIEWFGLGKSRLSTTSTITVAHIRSQNRRPLLRELGLRCHRSDVRRESLQSRVRT